MAQSVELTGQSVARMHDPVHAAPVLDELDELLDDVAEPPPPPIPRSVPGSTPMICTQPKARTRIAAGSAQLRAAITTSPAR
jgi:hypothetical protein